MSSRGTNWPASMVGRLRVGTIKCALNNGGPRNSPRAGQVQFRSPWTSNALDLDQLRRRPAPATTTTPPEPRPARSRPSKMPISPLTTFIIKRPWLSRWMIPLSKWYATKMGYRQLGLKYEDLLPEESPAMQLALKRLPPKEAYDRVFRLRRAFQVRSSPALLQ